jgi:hypothetical protein
MGKTRRPHLSRALVIGKSLSASQKSQESMLDTMSKFANDRLFFHSLPRPKAEESADVTLERGLQILAFMKEIGLVLAPEVVEWDVSVVSGGHEHLHILQRRACFTELSIAELPGQSAIFGPISLAFDIAKLRAAGAHPVIYVPQGIESGGLSHIATFCARGAYHTKLVLAQLENLRELSDPDLAAKRLGMPVAPNFSINLQNVDATGKVVADYPTAADTVRHVLSHVGFNSIPFLHSIGILDIYLNLFYPTDNPYRTDELGYYRQREWRLMAANLNIRGHSMTRNLSDVEIARLQEIDHGFWTRELILDGVRCQRSSLSVLYQPVSGWNILDIAHAIFVPRRAVDRVFAIVGDKIDIRPQD